MNQTEAVLLCRYAKGMCPAQAIDEYTPDAWAEVLYDITLEEAKAAIRDGIRERRWRFIDVADVVSSVRSVRMDRLNVYFRAHGHPVPPRRLDDDPRAGAEWLRGAQDRIAAGEVTHPSQLEGDDTSHLPRRDVIGELGQIGQEIPGE